MKTAHQIIRDFKAQHGITQEEENDYMRDNQVSEEERNIYDSRYLAHLETLVKERGEQ